MQSLTDKRVLVTGASSGIGRATATLFAAAGAHVVATGRSAEPLQALARDAKPGTVTPMVGDLTDDGFIATLVEAAGALDILVNNAGALKHAAFLDADPADWARVFEINVLALMRLTQPVARGMAARKRGHIINVSSLLARKVAAGTTIYAATKHAVAAITQGLRMELRPHGIRVTEIAPGLVNTSVFRDIDDPALRTRYATSTFERLNPVQIAEAIVFAASADANAGHDLIEIRPSAQE